MTHLRATLAAIALLAAPAVAAAPVETFPARFADRERMTTTAVLTGRGITRRQTARSANDDTLVFDDAAHLHIEDPDEPEPSIYATWRATGRRTAVFRFTDETVAALKAALADGLPFRMRIRVSPGRLLFSRSLRSYAGVQTIRGDGNYRGFHISIVTTIRYSGTEETGARAVAAPPATLLSALADGIARAAAAAR